jgi:hypothetical protein
MRILFALILVLASAGTCFAEINIYLYSRVSANRDLVLSDAALVEGDEETAGIVRSIPVDDSLLSDGYLDRKEIMELVKSRAGGRINVYGTGVRVIRQEGEGPSTSTAVLVKKGAPVRFQVVNSNVRIEMAGIALRDGNQGDLIPVKLAGRKSAAGKIVDEKTVELNL